MFPLLKRRKRLLLLDDDPSMQRLMSYLLKREGHVLDVVSEAEAAIEKIARRDYTALLLDVMTPTEGGLTVIKHLRESKPELLRRVVLVTASPESVLRGVEGDVFAIIKKPFDPKLLMKTIERLR